MALGIPLPLAPDVAFGQGLKGGADFYHQLVQHAIARAQERRAQEKLPYELKHMQAQMDLAKAASGRAAQARSEAHQKYLNELNPDYAANKFMHEMKVLGSMGGENEGSQTPSEAPPQQFNALKEMMQSRGMPQGQGAMMRPPEEQHQPEMMGGSAQQSFAPEQPHNQGIDWNNLNPIQKMWAAKHGYKPAAETPEQKRAGDFQSKLAFEKAKIDLGTEKDKQKAIVAAKKDLPQLQQSYFGVEELLKIAKENPDLFGHYMAPELYAKTTKNKNAGIFQNLLADRIAGLESKLSSKGNIVALKMAAQLKPSFAEQQNVAIGKLESMKKELKAAMARNEELAGGIKAKGSSNTEDPLGLFGE